MAFTAFFENAARKASHGSQGHSAGMVIGGLWLLVGMVFAFHHRPHPGLWLAPGATLFFWGGTGAAIRRPALRLACTIIALVLAIGCVIGLYHSIL